MQWRRGIVVGVCGVATEARYPHRCSQLVSPNRRATQSPSWAGTRPAASHWNPVCKYVTGGRTLEREWNVRIRAIQCDLATTARHLDRRRAVRSCNKSAAPRPAQGAPVAPDGLHAPTRPLAVTRDPLLAAALRRPAAARHLGGSPSLSLSLSSINSVEGATC